MLSPVLLAGMYHLVAVLIIGVLSSVVVRAAEPVAKKSDLPRVSPTEPALALGTFKIKEGFTLELAAAEPLVVDPVAMAFDEKSRLYVIEMIGYSEHREDRLGRVRLLEDIDRDGSFDKSTIFAKDLSWPTAVACYDGGIFVGATPDIIYLKDNDGDLKADERRVVLTGFGKGVERLNMQSLMNSFRWGLDNRIHGSASGTRGEVHVPGSPELGSVSFIRSDFSFNPRTFEFRLESGGAQHGMDFDSTGRKFVCSNSRHIQQVMYNQRYVGDNPNFMPTSPLIDIAIDGGAAPVFRRSPDEAWRVIRTSWRVKGQVRGPVEGGGRPSGYFTAATGITIYDGSVWPNEYMGDAFIADCGSNLIHRKKLYANGPKLTAMRPKDEKTSEFLASTDNWFRPVQMEIGPDGALYIADMYREVIEHPWSLPHGIKQHIDLDSGNDRGRIYRIVPEKFVQPIIPNFGNLSERELIQMLEHPSAWHRSTASRLLFERQKRSSIEPLRQLAQDGKTEYGRMQALYVLAGMDALISTDLVEACLDVSPIVRKHAIILIEDFLSEGQAEVVSKEKDLTPLIKSIIRVSNDEDKSVRYQLSWTLGKLEFTEKINILARLLQKAGGDPWQLTALLNAVTGNYDVIIEKLKMSSGFAASPFTESVLNSLERMQAGSMAQFSFSSSKAGYRPQRFKPSDKIDPDREKVINRFRPALGLRGDAKLGRELFEQRCAACHRLGGIGLNIGPDLKSVRANGNEKLLVSLIDPNREVAPEYMLQKIHLAKENETIVGVIKFISANGILVGFVDGSERQFVRSSDDKIESTQMSLMPIGLEAGLSVVQMANLLAWVQEAN